LIAEEIYLIKKAVLFKASIIYYGKNIGLKKLYVGSV
jgi:hypothetical protein